MSAACAHLGREFRQASAAVVDGGGDLEVRGNQVALGTHVLRGLLSVRHHVVRGPDRKMRTVRFRMVPGHWWSGIAVAGRRRWAGQVIVGRGGGIDRAAVARGRARVLWLLPRQKALILRLVRGAAHLVGRWCSKAVANGRF